MSSIRVFCKRILITTFICDVLKIHALLMTIVLPENPENQQR